MTEKKTVNKSRKKRELKILTETEKLIPSLSWYIQEIRKCNIYGYRDYHIYSDDCKDSDDRKGVYGTIWNRYRDQTMEAIVELELEKWQLVNFDEIQNVCNSYLLGLKHIEMTNYPKDFNIDTPNGSLCTNHDIIKHISTSFTIPQIQKFFNAIGRLMSKVNDKRYFKHHIAYIKLYENVIQKLDFCQKQIDESLKVAELAQKQHSGILFFLALKGISSQMLFGDDNNFQSFTKQYYKSKKIITGNKFKNFFKTLCQF